MLPNVGPYLTQCGNAQPVIVPDDWIIVISQTCDVVQANHPNEPFVEVLHCRRIQELRGEYQGRRSTRRLDFRPNKTSHGDVVLSAHAVADRYVIPREILRDANPDPARSLSDIAVSNLQQWYALRYTRPAWPDAFNERFDNKAKKRLSNAVKLLPIDEVEVRVAIAEKDLELDAETPYHLAVFFVVDQTAWNDDPGIREKVYASFSEFMATADACRGVVVNQEVSGVKSGDEFSWQLTRVTDEWNFANLSDQG